MAPDGLRMILSSGVTRTAWLLDGTTWTPRFIKSTSQRSKVATPCKHCHEIDHAASECAVAALHPRPVASGEDTTPPGDRLSTKGKRPAPYPQQRPICASWNAGSCRYPGVCKYAHVCLTCYGSRPASSCKERPYILPARHRPAARPAKET